MLCKKSIFYFLISFTAAFSLGFFIWSAFVDFPGNFIKPALAEVSSKFFTASIVPQDINLNINNQESPPKDVDLLNYTDAENLDSVVLVKEDEQDQLDDIQEKIDIIKQKVQELQLNQNQNIQLAIDDETEIPENKEKQDKDESKNDKNKDNKNNKNSINYQKILISEVQLAGIGDDKQEFVELYNPNNIDVDLTDWYLQRKTAGSSEWSTYVSNNLFSNKKISANGYFLIARVGYYLDLADIFTDNPITNDNSFALKNPNGDISDKLGFGNASEPELIATINPLDGQSIGRKLSNQDTDNNLNDFELQSLTPKSKNVKYISPPAGGGGGGGGLPIYLKILISEVKIAEKTGDNNVFIELYNPNNQDVDLTDWYIFRNGTSFITKTNFANKIIPANSYFLIAKEGSIWDAKADILFNGTLNDDDNIYLKKPNGDQIDEISWQKIAKGLSLGRKWDSVNNKEQDTADKLADFEIDSLTPKEQNITYIVPVLESIAIATPATKLIYNVGDEFDISGLTITGNYSDGSSQIESIFPENITGFDSATPTTGELLTITFKEKTATYLIDVIENDGTPPPSDTTPPSIITYIISNLILSTSNNTTNIDLAFSEKVKANVDILDSSGNKVKDLYYSSGVINPDAKVWNGKDNSDVVVPNGIYTIKIVITDLAGNTITDTTKTITVELTT